MITKDRLYQFVILALVLVILFLKMCDGKKCPSTEVVQTEIDTQYVNIIDTISVYAPEVTKYIPITKTIYKTDSLIEYQLVNVDTGAILRDYFATRYYEDVQAVQCGNLIIRDSVTENRIKSRSLTLNQNIPEVTKKITIREKPRNEIYFGLNGAGNKDNLYAGASLMLKTRKYFVIEGGALIGTDSKLLYHGGMKFIIRLKK